ncbi:hypothetical protein Taro_045764 [Colocasia esculenta]|uniref:Uncharacterized protein n=1 Tax=Colocasia esculenta TaxID=4460 RepID=A0A843WXT7_COLES|nr:hypothetical protein [Colocasia esculenta]
MAAGGSRAAAESLGGDLAEEVAGTLLRLPTPLGAVPLRLLTSQRKKLADSLASDLARMGISPSPVQHPDRTNTTLWLSVSSLRLQFDPNMIVHHYDVDVRPESLPMAVKAELFRVYAAQFPLQVLAYDGHRSLLSPGLLPEGDFRAATQAGMLHVGLKLLKAVPLQELQLDAKHVVYF